MTRRRPLRAELRGSVAIVTAVGMTVIICTAAIALDMANLYYLKSVDQRVVDQSAIAAAFAYQSSGSAATAQSAAVSLAKANGAANATLTTSIVNSPSGDGAQAAYVVISAPVALSGFGRAATKSQTNPSGISSFTVSASAYAEIHGATPCILATQTGGAGVTATGGTRITATACNVASNSGVSLSNGPTLTAPATYAVGSISAIAGSTINGSQFPNSSKQPDPYAGANLFARLSNAFFTNPTAPGFPSMPSSPAGGTGATCSGTLTIPGNASYGVIQTTSYPACSLISFSGGGTTSMLGLYLNGPSVTLSFGPGTYKIGYFTISNYGSTTITLSGTPTLDIYGALTLSSSQPITITGAATWNIEGGISDGASQPVTFSNGAGGSVSSFTVAGGISVTNNAATFPDGTYTVTSAGSSGYGLAVSGGATTTLGNGSFDIAGGISIGGGATLTIGGALNGTGLFEIPAITSGDDAIATGGSSMLSIGSFANSDINGPVAIAGSAALGGGIYTVNGALNVASGGGTITASNASFIASGPISFGAGFNAVTVNAPTAVSSSTEGSISTVALASSSSTASTVEAGASNTAVTGVVYFPNAALTLDGAGSLNGGGNCLQVIAQSIALSGGGSLSTSCGSLGVAGGNGSVTLVN
jgi:hypothetical protein